MMKYTCSYCGQELQSSITTPEGSLPTGTLVLCSCKQSRDAWEMQHRMEIERRKVARRKTMQKTAPVVRKGSRSR